MWVAFNNNRTPLAPPVTRILVNKKPKQRSTWDGNGVEGWYIGPSMQGHSCCYLFYISSTGGERLSDTVQFFPNNIAMSALSSQDKSTRYIRYIITILCNPVP